MRRSSALFVLLCLSGCTMVDVEQIPWVDTPSEWIYEPQDPLTTVNYRWWQEFHDEVLDGYIIEALQNNQDLLKSQATIDEFIARVWIAATPLLPYVGGEVFGTRQQISNAASPPPPIIPRIFNDFGLQLTASYELDVWGKIRNNLKSVKYRLGATIQAERTVILSLVSEVARAYFTLLQYDMQLKVSLDSLKAFEQAYDIAKYRFDGGVTSELPVKQADSEVQVARGRVVLYQLQVATQQNLLNVLLGRKPQAVERGHTLAEMKLPPRVPAGIPSDVLENRPDILGAGMELMSANADINVKLARLYPEFVLTGAYGNESLSLANLLTNPAVLWQYGLDALGTVFDAGRNTAEVNASEAIQRQLVHNYVEVVLNAFREVEDALITHQKRLEYLAVQNERVVVLKDYLELAQLQYSNGQTDYLSVLDAQRNLFNAELDQVAAMADCYISLIGIYKALGGGWVLDAEDLSEGYGCVES